MKVYQDARALGAAKLIFFRLLLLGEQGFEFRIRAQSQESEAFQLVILEPSHDQTDAFVAPVQPQRPQGGGEEFWRGVL